VLTLKFEIELNLVLKCHKQLSEVVVELGALLQVPLDLKECVMAGGPLLQQLFTG